MTRSLALGALFGLLLTPAASAVGGFDDETPTPTETTTTCPDGAVWDASVSACVVIQESRLDQDDLIAAARELAFAGRARDAIDLLHRAADPSDSMVLTYLGYAHRHAGQMDVGLEYYDDALAADPDNIRARAYLGMAYLQLGQIALAEAELGEIRARGGVGLWPEQALAAAVASGDGTAYDY